MTSPPPDTVPTAEPEGRYAAGGPADSSGDVRMGDEDEHSMAKPNDDGTAAGGDHQSGSDLAPPPGSSASGPTGPKYTSYRDKQQPKVLARFLSFLSRRSVPPFGLLSSSAQ